MLLRRQETQERDEHIDMTPMVDVVFQLMTFMLFSVQLSGEPEVDVPTARRGVGVEETVATFLTILKPENPGTPGRILVGQNKSGRQVNYDGAAEAVTEGVAKGLKKVVIEADGDVPEGEVLKLISELGKREAGVTIHIGVQDPN